MEGSTFGHELGQVLIPILVRFIARQLVYVQGQRNRVKDAMMLTDHDLLDV